MALPDIHNGRIYTHLDSLYEQIEHLESGRLTLSELAAGFNRDPVYRAVKGRAFRAPAPPMSSTAGVRLVERIVRIRQRVLPVSGPQLEPFLEAAEWFASSAAEPWDDDDYLTVPVMVSTTPVAAPTKEAQRPGFVYLRISPRLGLGQDLVGLRVEDLTTDIYLARSGGDYFGRLADAMLRTFFLVDRLPFDAEDELKHHSYRLWFHCQITEGESIGAACFVAYAIGFLRHTLCQSYRSAVAPRRGLVVTGALDDTRVVPVKDAAAKVAAAASEYGPSIRVVVPEGTKLPESVLGQINKGNVIYAGNAEQLLQAALTDGIDHGKGLHEARRKVFGALPTVTLRQLRKVTAPGFDPEIHTILATQASPSALESHDGLYVAVRAWQNYADIRLGLEPSAVMEQDEKDDREVIQVILDASREEPFWVPDKKTGVSPMTGVIYEIASAVKEEREDLAVAFLGVRRFYEVKPGTSARDIEEKLQGERARRRPEQLGTFFKPVYEESLKRFAKRQKRVVLISDSDVPDLKDRKDLRVSSFVALRLTSDPASDEPAHGDHNHVLFPDGRTLDRKVLSRYFARDHGALDNIEIRFGGELPVEWVPTQGELERESDEFILRWRLKGELRSRIQLRFFHAAPLTLGFAGEWIRTGDRLKFQFDTPCLTTAVEKFESGATGELEASELSLWRDICTPGRVCPYPNCHKTEVHMKHDDGMTISPVLAFPSLRKFQSGYIALVL